MEDPKDDTSKKTISHVYYKNKGNGEQQTIEFETSGLDLKSEQDEEVLKIISEEFGNIGEEENSKRENVVKRTVVYTTSSSNGGIDIDNQSIDIGEILGETGSSGEMKSDSLDTESLANISSEKHRTVTYEYHIEGGEKSSTIVDTVAQGEATSTITTTTTTVTKHIEMIQRDGKVYRIERDADGNVTEEEEVRVEDDGADGVVLSKPSDESYNQHRTEREIRQSEYVKEQQGASIALTQVSISILV